MTTDKHMYNNTNNNAANNDDDQANDYVHMNGSASDQMESLLNDTLMQYPRHYEAAQQILDTITASQRGWRCTGAMETGLTENGMEVTFDFRRVHGYWRRFLIVCTMNEGQITHRNFKELKQGEHSGIAAFEMAS